MARFLLLMFLCSWSLLTPEGCETGVAHVGAVLSIPRSLMANADVALLKSYFTHTVDLCMHDCCTGLFGACSIASFKKNSSKNCVHFNCRPVHKCKFLSSNTTDSFSFSSDLSTRPANHSSTTTSTTSSVTTSDSSSSVTQNITNKVVEIFANVLEDQQFAPKNGNKSVKPRKGVTEPTLDNFLNDTQTITSELTSDNGSITTPPSEIGPDGSMDDNKAIKPRKGVSELTPDSFLGKSGIKPRKGVSLDDVPHSKYLVEGGGKSNVKPRKGVVFSVIENETVSDNETVMSELKHIFDIQPSTTETSATITDSVAKTVQNSFQTSIKPSSVISHMATSTLPVTMFSSTIAVHSSLTSTVNQMPKDFESHRTMSHLDQTSRTTEHAIPDESIKNGYYSLSSSINQKETLKNGLLSLENQKENSVPSHQQSSSNSIKDDSRYSHEHKIFEDIDEDELEERRYKSSMHLVLSLVFGLLVLFAVLGVVAKRMYDSWQRRDYYRMNYLIDGVYNGTG